MVSSEKAVAGRSPLEQIRQAEAEVTRRVAAARKSAEAALKEAQVADFECEARELGRREGGARYQEIVSEAEQAAHALVTQAHSQTEDLRRKGQQRMEAAVRWAVGLVIGQEEETDGV
jgi:flagellar biosynthesis/type III secretory pathway protein FliH